MRPIGPLTNNEPSKVLKSIAWFRVNAGGSLSRQCLNSFELMSRTTAKHAKFFSVVHPAASHGQLALPAPPASTAATPSQPSALLALPAPEKDLEKKSNEDILEVVAPTGKEQPQRELKPQLSLEDQKMEPEKPKEPDAVEANQMLEQALHDRAQDKKEKEKGKDQQVKKQPELKRPAASKAVQKTVMNEEALSQAQACCKGCS